MPMFKRGCVVLLVILAACDGNSSTAPTPPANVVVVGGLGVIPVCRGCEPLLGANVLASFNCGRPWSANFSLMNTGSGCASNIRGVAILFQQPFVEGDPFRLAETVNFSTIDLRPGERTAVNVSGQINCPAGGKVAVLPSWNSVGCS